MRPDGPGLMKVERPPFLRDHELCEKEILNQDQEERCTCSREETHWSQAHLQDQG